LSRFEGREKKEKSSPRCRDRETSLILHALAKRCARSQNLALGSRGTNTQNTAEVAKRRLVSKDFLVGVISLTPDNTGKSPLHTIMRFLRFPFAG
jgi:hypothetical protein